MNLHFVNSTEAWIYFTYKTRTGTFNNSGALIHDFIETSVTPNGERRYGRHPTQKPESLIQHFVEILSKTNGFLIHLWEVEQQVLLLRERDEILLESN